jgi:hypothetical protein
VEVKTGLLVRGIDKQGLTSIQWAIQDLTFNRGSRLITGATASDFDFAEEVPSSTENQWIVTSSRNHSGTRVSRAALEPLEPAADAGGDPGLRPDDGGRRAGRRSAYRAWIQEGPSGGRSSVSVLAPLQHHQE